MQSLREADETSSQGEMFKIPAILNICLGRAGHLKDLGQGESLQMLR
jgi:hypothetical protein